jgi:hypothetical protein
MLLNEKAALRIGGHHITRRFKKALHEAAGLQVWSAALVATQAFLFAFHCIHLHIARQFKKALREAAGLQELKEDIIDRAGWSEEPDKFGAVDWKMHLRAQRNLI